PFFDCQVTSPSPRIDGLSEPRCHCTNHENSALWLAHPESGCVGIRNRTKLSQHFVNTYEHVAQHAFTRADGNIGIRIPRAVSALGGGHDSGEIIEISVRIAKQQTVAHRTLVAQADLKIH